MKIKKILLVMLTFVVMLTGCSKKDRVVIYTCMEENRNQELKERIAKDLPDIDVDIQYLSTGNAAAKIKNEGTSVEADIVIDLETAYMYDLSSNFADLSALSLWKSFEKIFYAD